MGRSSVERTSGALVFSYKIKDGKQPAKPVKMCYTRFYQILQISQIKSYWSVDPNAWHTGNLYFENGNFLPCVLMQIGSRGQKCAILSEALLAFHQYNHPLLNILSFHPYLLVILTHKYINLYHQLLQYVWYTCP